MEDLSLKSAQTTCVDTQAATSSPASEGGHSPSDSLDGLTIGQSGQGHALASPSVPQASKKRKRTKDTSGLRGTASSASFVLQEYMESRLLQLFPTDGSMECTLTWKKKDTPSGRLYCQLAASTRPIKETDSGLWQSPRARGDAGGDRWKHGEAKNFEDQVKIAAFWGTPRANDAEKRGMISQDPRNGLPGQALGTWATPNTMDHMDARSEDAMKHQFSTAREGRTAPANLREQVHPHLYPTALWSTPKASEAEKDIRTPEGALKEMERANSPSLSTQAAANWPTPNASDHRDRGKWDDPCIQRRVKLGKQVNLSMLAKSHGTIASGSSAETEKQGVSPQLSVDFVSWLMGFPLEWVSAMSKGMDSFPKKKGKR